MKSMNVHRGYLIEITLDGIIQLLRDRQHDISQAEFAKQLGVSPPYLSDVYAKRRSPGPKILNTLGIKKATIYYQEKPE